MTIRIKGATEYGHCRDWEVPDDFPIDLARMLSAPLFMEARVLVFYQVPQPFNRTTVTIDVVGGYPTVERRGFYVNIVKGSEVPHWIPTPWLVAVAFANERVGWQNGALGRYIWADKEWDEPRRWRIGQTLGVGNTYTGGIFSDILYKYRY